MSRTACRTSASTHCLCTQAAIRCRHCRTEPGKPPVRPHTQSLQWQRRSLIHGHTCRNLLPGVSVQTPLTDRHSHATHTWVGCPGSIQTLDRCARASSSGFNLKFALSSVNAAGSGSNSHVAPARDAAYSGRAPIQAPIPTNTLCFVCNNSSMARYDSISQPPVHDISAAKTAHGCSLEGGAVRGGSRHRAARARGKILGQRRPAHLPVAARRG